MSNTTAIASRNTWLTIRAFDRYEVNPLGEVRRTLNGKIKRPHDDGSVESVMLWDGEKHVRRTVGHLVAEAFIRNPHKHEYVWHKNGLRHDHRAANLEWISRREFFKRINASRHLRKTVLKIAPDGEAIEAYGSIAEAARDNFISETGVARRCKDRIIKKHDANGCTFAFEK